MHQSTTPSLSQTKMGIKTVPHRSYSPDLAPCDFWLFPKLRGCHYERIEMKEAVTKVIDTPTRGLPWGLPEVVETVQQVYCSQRKLLQRRLEFHVCTINKSAHTKKSGNLFNDPCTSQSNMNKKNNPFMAAYEINLKRKLTLKIEQIVVVEGIQKFIFQWEKCI